MCDPMSEISASELALRVAVKKELRKRMRGVRNTMPATAIAERSAKIVEQIEASDAFRRASTVALFWPIEGKNEVDLRSLFTRCEELGKRVVVPWADLERGEIALKVIEDPARLSDGAWGFAQPSDDALTMGRGEVDLVVVPALAIDTSGYRIGYGKGYYDRLLPTVAPPAETVGVAFDFQLLGEVPTTPGDFALSAVITDVRAFRVGEPVPSLTKRST